jgi:hypothetical protein
MNSHPAKVLVIFILVLLATNVFSQTSSNRPKLNISVGYLYSKLEEPKSYDKTVYYNYKTEAGNGHSISALVDFPINNFEISLGSSFSSSRIFLIYEFRPLPDQGLWREKDEVKMNYLNFRILLKYYPYNWLNIHTGFRFSFPINHQIRTLEVEAIIPDISVPSDYPLRVWEQYENFDVMDINIPMGVAFGLERGPFIAFNYYLGLVNITSRQQESPYLSWGDQRTNMFELSVGWKFDFKNNQ